MWKLAICQEVFGEVSFEECCERAASFGYDGIEVAPYILSADISSLGLDEIDGVRTTASRHGLALPAMHWLLASPPAMSITSPDPVVRQHTVSFMRSLVHVAERLGTKVLVFGSPKQRNIDPAWPREEAYGRGIEFLTGMARACEAHGIVVAFEPLGPATTNFGATIDEALDIVGRVGSDSMRLQIDVKAMLTEADPPGRIIDKLKGRIAHVHANDTNLLGPGMGSVEYRPILQALADARYGGWISVEPFRTDVEADEIAARSIAYLREQLLDGDLGETRDPSDKMV